MLLKILEKIQRLSPITQMPCKPFCLGHELKYDSTALHSFKAAGQLFDVVDLDPYGSAVPFLDSAIANITDGGMSLFVYNTYLLYFRTALYHLH